MIDKSRLTYSQWKEIFTKTIEDYFICAFQCEHCKKVFKKKYLDSFDIPLSFPVLKYSFESGFGTGSSEFYFCSLDCLHELLKKVPFGFTVSVPSYFSSFNKRDFIFNKEWEILE